MASAIYIYIYREEGSSLYRLDDLPNKESDLRRRRTSVWSIDANEQQRLLFHAFEFRNFLHFFFSFFFYCLFFLVLVTLTLSGTLARLFNTRRLGQVYERKTFHASKEKKKERKKKKKYLATFQRLITTFVNDVHDPAQTTMPVIQCTAWSRGNARLKF